jgi:hypothetical protein
MSTFLTDQHWSVSIDDRHLRPGPAGDADLQVDGREFVGAQPNNSSKKLSRRLCPLCPLWPYGGGESR